MPSIQLVAYFKSRTLRNIALKAAIDVHGEDGWSPFTVVDGKRVDFVEGRGYAADIVCTGIPDAVSTWAGLFIAVAKAHGVAMDPSEVQADYLPEEV